MPDGSLYVDVSYGLTVLVLAGYALRLALRGRAVRRRLDAHRDTTPSRPGAPGAAGGGAPPHPTRTETREVSRV